ncbi:hypothetical protein AZE42_08709 [Rhizopogon vesiculosus]|uniref:Uncharacterized protein n=1 Tax=Rhizopogon vesiculosus TaxID=180088 RepID=A0A1J8QZV8_9AGAM|nr:hypothetical protein AZE42_08709 [Rhizopogon vesiculosus]
MAYVAQQQLDGYNGTVQYAMKRKAALDKRILARSNLNTTPEAKRKLLLRWSPPCRITERRNSYRLEMLAGEPMSGEFHTRRLRAFVPHEGTKLAEEQEKWESERGKAAVDEEATGKLEEERREWRHGKAQGYMVEEIEEEHGASGADEDVAVFRARHVK